MNANVKKFFFQMFFENPVTLKYALTNAA